MISKNDRYGAQRIFIDQVASLHALGHAVTVVARGNEGYVADSIRALGVPYHGVPMKGLGDVLSLRSLVVKQKIDMIHTTLDRADYLGLVLSKLTGVPAVSTMMVPRFHPGLRFMDRLIVLSRKQKQILEKQSVNGSKVSVIRPGIDLGRFTRPDPRKRELWKEKLGTDAHAPVLCHISSMLPRKAHAVSLELTAGFKRRGARPLLVIIGDPLEGEYYQSLRRMIGDLRVENNVVFTGWTADVAEILSLSHFTVLPSEDEALGVVLMEGMAAGTPVIARQGEGGAELVEDYGAGFLFHPHEGVEPLADRVLELVHDGKRYQELSSKSRDIAAREFSLSAFGNRLCEVYEQAMNKR
jgi:glycosyltransferase involved in cell wall biosynthesis